MWIDCAACALAAILAWSALLSSAEARVCDDSGQCLDARASRIVPLYGAFSEMLLELGAGDRIAARAKADAGIPELAHLPQIGTHMQPNLELILAARPDAILQLGGRAEASRHAWHLRRLGAPVLCFNMATFEQMFSVMRRLGLMTGTEARAEGVCAAWRKRLDRLAAAAPQKRPGVYYEARSKDPLAAAQGHIVNDIIEKAGGRNIIKAQGKFSRFDEEALLLADPDFCIVQQGPMNPNPLPFSERPNLRHLKCARPGRQLVVNEREWARPGPASVKAAEELAAALAKAAMEEL